MLEFWLRKLQINEISKVVVNTHHLADLVVSEIIQSNISSDVQVFHENKLLGTAGTLLANLELTFDSDVLVLHCDNFSDIDISDFLSAHNLRHRECLITMAIFETNNVQMSGMVETDEDGIVRKLIEKPKYSDLTMANAALYIFDKRALNEILEKYGNAKDIVNDILIHFIGRIQTYSWSGFHMDMGSLENLKIIRDKFESKS